MVLFPPLGVVKFKNPLRGATRNIEDRCGGPRFDQSRIRLNASDRFYLFCRALT